MHSHNWPFGCINCRVSKGRAGLAAGFFVGAVALAACGSGGSSVPSADQAKAVARIPGSSGSRGSGGTLASGAQPTQRGATTTTTTTTTLAGGAQETATPEFPQQLASTGGAQQVIIVDAPDAASTTATLTAYEDDGKGWYEAFSPMPAYTGENGWLPGPDRIWGDQTTPEGMYAIGPTMYGTEPNPGTKFPYQQLVCGDWWDEDPSSPTYNTFQQVACGTTPPFAADSEALWTEGNAYPSMAVIDFNTPPTGPLGAGIFLHADIGAPTQGCVSLPLSDLDAVLDWLNPALHPVIVMGPDAVIRSF